MVSSERSTTVAGVTGLGPQRCGGPASERATRTREIAFHDSNAMSLRSSSRSLAQIGCTPCAVRAFRAPAPTSPRAAASSRRRRFASPAAEARPAAATSSTPPITKMALHASNAWRSSTPAPLPRAAPPRSAAYSLPIRGPPRVRPRQIATPENANGAAPIAQKIRKLKNVWAEREIPMGTARRITRHTGRRAPMPAQALPMRSSTFSSGKARGRSCTKSAPAVRPSIAVEMETNAR